MGADVCTCPAKVIDALFKHPLTDIGLAQLPQGLGKVPGGKGVVDPHARSTSSSGEPSSVAAKNACRRQRAAGKLTARERIDLAVRPGHLRGNRQARHPPLPRLRDGRSGHPGRRRRRRPRPRRGPHGLRVRAGLHRVRRVALGDQRGEDRQGDGPGDEDRRADRRPERLGRRAHPGRRAVARRLRRHLPSQHAGLRRRPADFGRDGSVRGRRRVLAGHHRFHRHGARLELHVRDRVRTSSRRSRTKTSRRKSSAAP